MGGEIAYGNLERKMEPQWVRSGQGRTDLSDSCSFAKFHGWARRLRSGRRKDSVPRVGRVAFVHDVEGDLAALEGGSP